MVRSLSRAWLERVEGTGLDEEDIEGMGVDEGSTECKYQGDGRILSSGWRFM